MTEWLTTGEMIDRLKVGEIAQDKNGATVRRGNHGLETREGRFINCNYLFLSQRWHILPNYVTFHEAMEAHQEGKTITYHHDEFLKYTFVCESEPHQFASLYHDSIYLHELIDGKWTIEND